MAVRTFSAQSIGMNRTKPAMNRLSTTSCRFRVASQLAIASDRAAAAKTKNITVRTRADPRRNDPKMHSKTRK
ncbi:hypothetical protein D3C74_488240 [compost metagenome]